MKKSLVALAALAVVGAASAQSTVTIYGAIDASYNHASSGALSKTSMGSSQLGSSKLGFMGTEDLGGGLKANFKIEGGLNNDSGAGKATNTNNQAGGGVAGAKDAVTIPACAALPCPAATVSSASSGGFVFQRFSYVGLSGGFGEFRMGRDYVDTFLGAQAALDPFGTNGPADSTQLMLALGLGGAASGLKAVGGAVATVTNASNMFEYISPNMSGFNVVGQIWYGENTQGTATSTKAGDGSSFGAHYANGPIAFNISTATTKAGVASATNGDYKLTAWSGAYDLGVAKLIVTSSKETVSNTAATQPYNKGFQLGAIVPMGAANFKVSYVTAKNNVDALAIAAGNTEGKATLLGLGVDYALSKRTTAYATYAHVSNKNGGSIYSTGVSDGTANGGSTNYAFGVKHNF